MHWCFLHTANVENDVLYKNSCKVFIKTFQVKTGISHFGIFSRWLKSEKFVFSCGQTYIIKKYPYTKKTLGCIRTFPPRIKLQWHRNVCVGSGFSVKEYIFKTNLQEESLVVQGIVYKNVFKGDVLKKRISREIGLRGGSSCKERSCGIYKENCRFIWLNAKRTIEINNQVDLCISFSVQCRTSSTRKYSLFFFLIICHSDLLFNLIREKSSAAK